MKEKFEKEDKTNYSFILKWMAAVTAAAILALAITASFFAKAGAVAAVGITMAASAPVMPIVFGVLGAVTLIALLCFLVPSLCTSRSTSVVSSGYTPTWGWGAPLFFGGSGHHHHGHHHGHHHSHHHGHTGGFFGGHTHGHSGGGHVHGHSGGGHVHGHSGGGHVHGHR